MEISMYELSVCFRKFGAALAELPDEDESRSSMVELDLEIEQAFRAGDQITDELGERIAREFRLIIERVGTLSHYLVERIDETQKLMLVCALQEEEDPEFTHWSSQLSTLLDRFQNLAALSRVLRQVRQKYAGTK